MKNFKVLFVEDDLFIARVVTKRLEMEGYFTMHCSDIASMLLHLNKFKFDAIILDVSLPSGNTVDKVERLKKIDASKLLIFTATEDTKNELRGVKVGVDDFILKSRGVDILIERLKKSLLSELKKVVLPSVPHLSISYDEKIIRYKNQVINITPNEKKVFYILYRDFDTLVTRDELASGCYGVEYDGYSRGIDLIISRLRKKLKEELDGGLMIKSIRGGGYKLTHANQ